MRAPRLLAAACLVTAALLAQPAAAATPTTNSPTAVANGGPATSALAPQLPVLAYYYQWFNASSWNRAKHDYPSIGRYTSDETTVMRTHIREAKSAGITGFLVSWKDTPLNDERLDKLVTVAREERFTLGVVYQGLDVKGKILVELAGGATEVAPVVVALDESGIAVESLELVQPSLDDVFVAKTGYHLEAEEEDTGEQETEPT